MPRADPGNAALQAEYSALENRLSRQDEAYNRFCGENGLAAQYERLRAADGGSSQNRTTDKQQNVWTNAEDSVTLETRGTVELESSTQRTFQSQKLLEYHFNKHLQEYGTISIPDYLRKANELADAPLSEDVVELLRSDGSASRYRFSTNDFVVINADRTIRTLFKPKRKEAYWQDELGRN